MSLDPSSFLPTEEPKLSQAEQEQLALLQAVNSATGANFQPGDLSEGQLRAAYFSVSGQPMQYSQKVAMSDKELPDLDKLNADFSKQQEEVQKVADTKISSEDAQAALDALAAAEANKQAKLRAEAPGEVITNLATGNQFSSQNLTPEQVSLFKDNSLVEQVAGAARQLATPVVNNAVGLAKTGIGTAKEIAGNVVGSESLTQEGEAMQRKGLAQMGEATVRTDQILQGGFDKALRLSDTLTDAAAKTALSALNDDGPAYQLLGAVPALKAGVDALKAVGVLQTLTPEQKVQAQQARELRKQELVAKAEKGDRSALYDLALDMHGDEVSRIIEERDDALDIGGATAAVGMALDPINAALVFGPTTAKALESATKVGLEGAEAVGKAGVELASKNASKLELAREASKARKAARLAEKAKAEAEVTGVIASPTTSGVEAAVAAAEPATWKGKAFKLGKDLLVDRFGPAAVLGGTLSTISPTLGLIGAALGPLVFQGGKSGFGVAAKMFAAGGTYGKTRGLRLLSRVLGTGARSLEKAQGVATAATKAADPFGNAVSSAVKEGTIDKTTGGWLRDRLPNLNPFALGNSGLNAVSKLTASSARGLLKAGEVADAMKLSEVGATMANFATINATVGAAAEYAYNDNSTAGDILGAGVEGAKQGATAGLLMAPLGVFVAGKVKPNFDLKGKLDAESFSVVRGKDGGKPVIGKDLQALRNVSQAAGNANVKIVRSATATPEFVVDANGNATLTVPVGPDGSVAKGLQLASGRLLTSSAVPLPVRLSAVQQIAANAMPSELKAFAKLWDAQNPDSPVKMSHAFEDFSRVTSPAERNLQAKRQGDAWRLLAGEYYGEQAKLLQGDKSILKPNPEIQDIIKDFSSGSLNFIELAGLDGVVKELNSPAAKAAQSRLAKADVAKTEKIQAEQAAFETDKLKASLALDAVLKPTDIKRINNVVKALDRQIAREKNITTRARLLAKKAELLQRVEAQPKD